MIDKVQTPNKNSISEPENSAGIEIDLFKLLNRHWPLLTLCLLLGWAGAAAYYYYTPPTYESAAQVLLMPKDARLATKGVDGSKEMNSTISEDLLSTHMMIVQSPVMVRDALRKSQLEDLPSLVDSMSSKDRSTTDYVLRKLSVSRGGSGKAKSAQVLKIAMRHNNAEDSQSVVAAIVSEFRDFISKKYTDMNENAADLITTANGQLQSELKQAELDSANSERTLLSCGTATKAPTFIEPNMSRSKQI